GSRLQAPRVRPAHMVAGRDAQSLPRHRRAPRRRTGRRAPGDPRGQRRTALPPAPGRPDAPVAAGAAPGGVRPPLPPTAAPRGVTVRLDELLRDLEGDRVIAARLAHRHYRVPLKRARADGLAVRTLQVPPTAGSRVARRVSVLLWPEERRLLRVKPPVIRHLAGVTACRLYLGAPFELWHNDAGRPLGLLQPDGLWWQPHAGPDVAKAIEYDAGSYSRAQVVAKVEAFGRRFGYQIWGVAGRERSRFVRDLLLETGSAGEAHHVPWSEFVRPPISE